MQVVGGGTNVVESGAGGCPDWCHDGTIEIPGSRAEEGAGIV